MEDAYFRVLVFCLINLSIFSGTYLFGRRYHPKLALWLSACSCTVMMVLCYYSITWMGFSLILSLVYLRVLRKPNQAEAFRELFAANNIYTSQKSSQALLDILGDKKWRYAEGSFNGNNSVKIPFLFWQGRTSSMVSSGQFVRTTVFTHYLAFIFPPGSVSNPFKQRVLAAADRSHYTLIQKIRFFFVHDTETPNLVTTAADGSFIIQYLTISDVEHYTRRINWIKENIVPTYVPVTKSSFGYN